MQTTSNAEPLSEIPALALLAALTQMQQGMILYEPGGRLLHVSERARELLELAPLTAQGTSDLAALLRSAPGIAALASDLFAYLTAAPDRRQNAWMPAAGLRFGWRDVHEGKRVLLVEAFAGDVTPPEGQPEDDFLTGLASRAKFEANLEAALLTGAALAVMLIDLDHFKAVNDTLGHGAGDTLLKRVGQRLKSSMRAGDLAARFGGDEFALLIRDSISSEELSGIASRIVEVMRRSFLIDGQLAHIGASIGIAIFPQDGRTARDLLRSADLALYESKSAGGGRATFYDPKLLEKEQLRRNGEYELRRALALRQFELHYQPQLDSHSKLAGFEALIRWRHPERGLIAPLEFLPVIERVGMMAQVGEWVLRTACLEAMKWPDDIYVAVNVAPSQLACKQFAARVRHILETTGLPGRRLELEITEDSLVGDAAAVNVLLQELRTLGVSLAIDDFGTGYASMSQLATFPFDKIKIDRSLSGADPRERALVKAIAQLGDDLGLSTLAEGVESQEQMCQLRLDGCEFLQGYHLGRPMPAAEVAALLDRERK